MRSQLHQHEIRVCLVAEWRRAYPVLLPYLIIHSLVRRLPLILFIRLSIPAAAAHPEATIFPLSFLQTTVSLAPVSVRATVPTTALSPYTSNTEQRRGEIGEVTSHAHSPGLQICILEIGYISHISSDIYTSFIFLCAG